MKGRIHSIETLGTLDGPGVRYVIFFQGCPMRCGYCHNPDTWDPKGGEPADSEEIIKKIIHYKPYFGTEGGVTFSGGEPLMQAEFLLDMLKKCRSNGINTAIDTNGFLLNDTVKSCLSICDLVILDVKHTDPKKHKELTGMELRNTIKFFKYLAEKNIPIWIRQVIIPGINDTEKDIIRLAELLKNIKSVKKVELLPYHKMGLAKWKRLKITCPLEDFPEPTPEKMQSLKELLKRLS